MSLKAIAPSDYRRLTHPEVPPGWRHCGVCGKPMEWRHVAGGTFLRSTGEPYRQWRYVCTVISSHDLRPIGHDDYGDGDHLAAYLWETA